MDDDRRSTICTIRLVFTASRPVLAKEARVALTLRLLGGSRPRRSRGPSWSRSPPVAQRHVRAKRALAEAQVPFEVPRGEALAARLSSVLEVVYLVFSTATPARPATT